MQRSSQHIFVITGGVHEGKTTFLTELLERLSEEKLKIAGFLCPGFFKDGARSGFNLLNTADGNQLPLATIEEKQGWFKFHRFNFNPEAFQVGETWIREALSLQPDLLVIDEVGPMELQGKGWWDTLKIIEKRCDIAQIWVVREQLIQDVKDLWCIDDDHIFRIGAAGNGLLFDKLYDKLKRP